MNRPDFKTAAMALTVLALASCAQQNPGVAPPSDAFQYPTSLALAEPTPGTPGVLYVVNANFDLRYNRGTVMALDLSKLPEPPDGPIIPAVTGAGDGVRACSADTPGIACIDSFGGRNALYSPPGATPTQRTLFVPTRQNQRLYALNVDGTAVACAAAGGQDCAAQGVQLFQTDVVQAIDPFGVALQDNVLYVGHLQPVDAPLHSQTNWHSFLVQLDAQAPTAPTFIPAGTAPVDAVVATPAGVYLTGRAPRSPQQTEYGTVRTLTNGNIVNTPVADATHVHEARGAAVSSDGTRLFIIGRTCSGCPSDSALLTLDISKDATGAAKNTVLSVSILPRGSSEIVSIPRPGLRDLVAVSGTDANQLALYDDELGTVAALVPGISTPFGIAVGARPGGGARLFVATFIGQSVDVVDVPDLSRPRTAFVAGRLQGPPPPSDTTTSTGTTP